MSGFFHQHRFINKNPDFESGIGQTSGEYFMVPSAWQEHNNNNINNNNGSRVFPNQRPSQGLSLSLSSSNPSSIGLQSFELIRHAADDSNNPDNLEEIRFMDSCSIRDVGFFGKPTSVPPLHQLIVSEGPQFDLRTCKYLGPTRELLNEFCGLETTQNDVVPKRTQKQKQQSLHSFEFVDLQKRKKKLFSMLEEVERRYRHYCDQMKAVVSSFESAAGEGAAEVYSSLASKAMSKHFRSLKDGIVAEINATRKAMGEKEPVVPGTSRGETPRLRVIDQTLRHQRALQQMNMMQTHPWRPQRGLPERSVSILRAWLFEHFLHPYPSDVDKHILARQTGLSRSQVSNWFINARVRLWKPMVEEMYMEESNDGVIEKDDGRPSTLNLPSSDLKPTPDQLQLPQIDSECLSSIISNSDKNHSTSNRGLPNKGFHGHHDHQPASFGSFGAVELDFSSYNQPALAATCGVSFAHHGEGTSGAHGRVGGGGVSLTLGLQQHGGNDVNLEFSPASQSSLYFSRDHIGDCQTGQYSILDEEDENSAYGNLMGAQLLHDLAG